MDTEQAELRRQVRRRVDNRVDTVGYSIAQEARVESYLQPTPQPGMDRFGYMVMREPGPPYVNTSAAIEMTVRAPAPPPPRPEIAESPIEESRAVAEDLPSPTTSPAAEIILPEPPAPKKSCSKFKCLEILLILGLYFLQIANLVVSSSQCQARTQVDSNPIPSSTLTLSTITTESTTDMLVDQTTETFTRKDQGPRCPCGITLALLSQSVSQLHQLLVKREQVRHCSELRFRKCLQEEGKKEIIKFICVL